MLVTIGEDLIKFLKEMDHPPGHLITFSKIPDL